MSQKSIGVIRNLFYALSRLAQNRDMKSIRIFDICQEAGIHRATFYRHLENIQDLLERGTELFWDDLLSSMEEIRRTQRQKREAIPPYLQNFFQLVMVSKSVFRAFLIQNSTNVFQISTKKRIIDFLQQHRLTGVVNSDHRKQLSHMIAASLIAVVELMIEDDEYLPYLKRYYRFVRNAVGHE